MKNLLLSLIITLSSITLFSACAADSGTKSANTQNNGYNTGNINVGGVQDIGVFRDIVNSGGIPGPDTLDPNGFFSEHYMEYPFEDCGEDICLFGMLGRGLSVLSSDYMNILQVGMQTTVNPLDYERPPTDFIAVIDVSGSMYGEKMEFVRQGLHMMVDTLNPDDRMALITYSSQASEIQPLLYAATSEDRQTMHANINRLWAGGGTNIYDGLLMGFELAEESRQEERYARIVFLSDGQPTSGITDHHLILAMARERASKTSQLTSIGVGRDVNFPLMRDLAMAGGNFYFIENVMALTDIFVEEVNFFSFPVAENVRFSLTSGSGFHIGDSVGFENFAGSELGGEAHFPALYLASRTSSNSENPSTRRGGGSAMFVRIVPKHAGLDLDGIVLTMSYDDPVTGETIGPQRLTVSDLSDGGVLPTTDFYSETVMKKSFTMLNLYLGLKEVCQRASYSNFEGARDLLQTTIDYAYNMNASMEDADISADIVLMEKLLRNINDNYYYYCDYGECHYHDDVWMGPGCSTSGRGSGGGTFPLFAILLGLGLIRFRRG